MGKSFSNSIKSNLTYEARKNSLALNVFFCSTNFHRVLNIHPQLKDYNVLAGKVRKVGCLLSCIFMLKKQCQRNKNKCCKLIISSNCNQKHFFKALVKNAHLMEIYQD